MRNFKTSLLAGLVTALAVVAWACNSQAAIVSFTLTGDVTIADPQNVFGLAVGDTITASGEYDDSYYDGVGLKEVPFGAETGNLLSIRLGDFLLTELNDKDFQEKFFPTVTFFNGQVADTNIQMIAGVNDSTVDFSSDTTFLAGFFNDGGGNEESSSLSGTLQNELDTSIVSGHWRVVTVPEPSGGAALGVVAVGIGAGAARRRRQQKLAAN